MTPACTGLRVELEAAGDWLADCQGFGDQRLAGRLRRMDVEDEVGAGKADLVVQVDGELEASHGWPFKETLTGAVRRGNGRRSVGFPEKAGAESGDLRGAERAGKNDKSAPRMRPLAAYAPPGCMARRAAPGRLTPLIKTLIEAVAMLLSCKTTLKMLFCKT